MSAALEMALANAHNRGTPAEIIDYLVKAYTAHIADNNDGSPLNVHETALLRDFQEFAVKLLAENPPVMSSYADAGHVLILRDGMQLLVGAVPSEDGKAAPMAPVGVPVTRQQRKRGEPREEEADGSIQITK